jgi:hypothetical protein
MFLGHGLLLDLCPYRTLKSPFSIVLASHGRSTYETMYALLAGALLTDLPKPGEALYNLDSMAKTVKFDRAVHAEMLRHESCGHSCESDGLLILVFSR